MEFIQVTFAHKGHKGVYLLARRDFDPAVHTLYDPTAPPALREDGPTLEEWCAAGYQAEHYPPQGYAEKPSPALTVYRENGWEPVAPVVRAEPVVDEPIAAEPETTAAEAVTIPAADEPKPAVDETAVPAPKPARARRPR